MSKRKLQLVPNPAVVSGLSHGEEARALQLADIALHNPAETNIPVLAGSRAKGDHRRLIEEVQGAAKKVLGSKRAA